MAFCAKCGKLLNENDMFCSGCGAPQKPSKANHQYSEQRQNVYVGNVRKCPSCGAELSSFIAICPQCGHELNSVEVPESIRFFTTRINTFDNEIANNSYIKYWKEWNKKKKIGWIILNIFTFGIPLLIHWLFLIIGIGRNGRFNAIESKKEAFINDYSFPNERESVLEALLFIKSQITNLLTAPKNAKTKKWIQIWYNKAQQLLKQAQIILQEDEIAQNTYSEIITVKNNFDKSIIIKSLVILLLNILCTLFFISTFITILSGIGIVRNGYGRSSAMIPAIAENAVTNEKEGIISYQVKNYIGKNAASIGKVINDYLIDEYGDGCVKFVFVNEDGSLISNDTETRKNYIITQQNSPAGSTLTIVYDRNNDGTISNYVSYQSVDEIVLYVTPINQKPYKPNPTLIKPTLDKHKYHIRDYIGRNAASFGKDINKNRIDEYGEGHIKIIFASEDGHYVDESNVDELKRYVITNQDIEANSDLIFTFEKNDYGLELMFIQSQSIEEITLFVKKIK